MARPAPVPGLRPELPAIAAARLVIEVRLEEVTDLSPAVADPALAQAHHDLRIAAKRLRYSLETFDELFAADLAPFAREMRLVQDHLGRIHDYDVFVPWFERYRDFRRLEGENKLRTTMLSGTRRAGRQTMADYRAALDSAADPEEDEAILRLIERTRARREAAFAEFQIFWRELLAGNFPERLRNALV